MKYEVTIGIPVYKAIDYIERTMESALNQTFASIEYLIVDDYGNDGTINVIERFQREHQRGKDILERFQREHQRGKDIRILYNKQNLGVGRTRNIILGKAQVLNSGYLMKLYTIYDKSQANSSVSSQTFAKLFLLWIRIPTDFFVVVSCDFVGDN